MLIEQITLSQPANVVYHYQSLIAGLVALIAALISISGLFYAEARKQHFQRRQAVREHRVSVVRLQRYLRDMTDEDSWFGMSEIAEKGHQLLELLAPENALISDLFDQLRGDSEARIEARLLLKEMELPHFTKLNSYCPKTIEALVFSLRFFSSLQNTYLLSHGTEGSLESEDATLNSEELETLCQESGLNALRAIMDQLSILRNFHPESQQYSKSFMSLIPHMRFLQEFEPERPQRVSLKDIARK